MDGARMSPMDGATRGLGLSPTGERLKVSFTGGGGGGPPAFTADWSARPGALGLSSDAVERQRVMQDRLKRSPRRDTDLEAKVRALGTRIGVRETEATRHATGGLASSPRRRAAPGGGACKASPPTRLAHSRAAHSHAARPWASQRAVEKNAEDLWKRSSAAEHVQALQGLADTLNSPRPLVQVTTRRSVDSIVSRERTAATKTITGRLSAADFVKQLRGGNAPSPRRRSPTLGSAPSPQPAARSAQVSALINGADRTPPRPNFDQYGSPVTGLAPAPVQAAAAANFSDWYSKSYERGSSAPASPSSAGFSPQKEQPAPMPEIEPAPHLKLSPGTPVASPARVQARATALRRSSPARAEVRPPLAVPQLATVRGHQGRAGPVASPRTAERRQRVAALASAARDGR